MTPLEQTKLLSFEDNFKNLVSLSSNQNLPNKLLFRGQKGIGKSTFAYHFINYLFSYNENNAYDLKNNEISKDNKSYKLVLNNSHPNFLLINSADKKFIEVSKIREILNFSIKTSFSNKKKIVLIDNVENLNINAANSLLKILEEPSTDLFFILIHNSYKKIISTVSSRCIKYNFTLSDLEREKIILNLVNNEFYETLPVDFKTKYLSPKFYIDLYDFAKTEKLNIKEMNIIIFLNYIFNKKSYLKNNFINEYLQNLIEIYFYKKILKQNNFEQDFGLFKKTINKLNNMDKFNLDKDSSLSEVKNIIFNER